MRRNTMRSELSVSSVFTCSTCACLNLKLNSQVTCAPEEKGNVREEEERQRKQLHQLRLQEEKRRAGEREEKRRERRECKATFELLQM